MSFTLSYCTKSVTKTLNLYSLSVWYNFSLQILQYQSQQSYQNKVVPSAAVLFVYVERAHGLPVRSYLWVLRELYLVYCDVIFFALKEEVQSFLSLPVPMYSVNCSIFCLWFQLKKSGKEPKVGADVILKGISHRTKVVLWRLSLVNATKETSCSNVIDLSGYFSPQICERSTSPRWDEAFHYLVRDPRDETLTVKVRVI